jgi:hypothetical protein
MPTSKKYKLRRKSKKRNQRVVVKGGSWLTNSQDWKLGSTLVASGYKLPIGNIGSTTSYKYNIVGYPIDNYYALPCIDYTQ